MCDAGPPRVELVHTEVSMVGIFGKARKDGDKEQAGDLLSLLQVHRAHWDSHSGKTLCSCQKNKLNRSGQGANRAMVPTGSRNESENVF